MSWLDEAVEKAQFSGVLADWLVTPERFLALAEVVRAARYYRRAVIGEMDESLGGDVRLEEAPDYPGSPLAALDDALALLDEPKEKT